MNLKKALKKYDVEIVPETSCRFAHYKIGDKHIYFGRVTERWWSNNGKIFGSEESAVAWLIDGATPLSPMEQACKKWYKPEGGDPKLPVMITLEHVDVERSYEKLTENSVDVNVSLNFYPNQAQIVLDTIWQAGYRPTKMAK